MADRSSGPDRYIGRLDGEQNPFLRYRDRLDSHRRAREAGLSEDDFVELVAGLDAEIEAIDGSGFTVTPIIDGASVADAVLDETAALTGDIELMIKDETGNVAGSHKARHLFGVALHLLLDERLNAAPSGGSRAPLAIASCGNAALAAGVVAGAMKRELQVFVPTWAERPVIERLESLGAGVNVCPRRQGEAGDPAFHRYREAVGDGAVPFTVQGSETPPTFDGGRTLGWELGEQAGPFDAVYVQVGGGALALTVAMGLPGTRLYPVQAEGCAPLRRAWDRLAPEFDFDDAASHPDDFMWPWESEPISAASGILDDVTYDWLPLLRRTRGSGGEPLVVAESLIVEAHRIGRLQTDIPVSATGTAGLAGLMHHQPTSGRFAVAFTGLER